MTLFLAALGVLIAGGLAAAAASVRPRVALALGCSSAALGCALGLVPAVRVLLGHAGGQAIVPWDLPYGPMALRLDPLGALFAVAVFGLGLPAAIYAFGYLRPHLHRRSLGAFCAFFNLLLTSMAALAAAQHAFLFLFAWETMSIASFFLVTFEDEREEVRDAGRLYLIASHLGTAFLFAMFLAMGRLAGSLDFAALESLHALPAGVAATFFGMAVVGFGVKAGFMPLHVWLPEAHPAAPSHVSAVMSGAMIKMGLLGLLRVLAFLPPAPEAYGWFLLALGVGGGAAAIALSLGQRDLKRALAYSSIENVGIIAAGLGLGLVGAARGLPVVAALGFAGAILHVWNHALMKGLLFMAAGALAHAAGGRDLEAMGGLLRRLPCTGTLFVLGAAAIAALPPLNGFASEWLIYLGLARDGAAFGGYSSLAADLFMVGLAIVGTVAAIAFTRLAGVALLGQPRSEGAAHAHEAPASMLWSMAFLAAGCVGVGLAPDAALSLAWPAVTQVASRGPQSLPIALSYASTALGVPMRAIALCLVATGLALALARHALLRRRAVAASGTWGCGYAAPTARMQYTASSYAELMASSLMPRGVSPRTRDPLFPTGLFPPSARLSVVTRDPVRHRLFLPLFAWMQERLVRLRRLQAGMLNLQLFYPLLALAGLALLLVLRRRP